MSLLALGEKLKKTLPELLQMSVYEFNIWVAYFEKQQLEYEKEIKRSKLR